MKKIIIILCFCLLKITAFSQDKKNNCTINDNDKAWISKSYEKIKFWIEYEEIKLNNNSYWLIGSSSGEVVSVFSAIITPTKDETLIFQPMTDKQIVKEAVTIKYLLKYFKKINKNIESNIVANAKFYILELDEKGLGKCIEEFNSVEFPPFKNNEEDWIDFNKIIKEMNNL